MNRIIKALTTFFSFLQKLAVVLYLIMLLLALSLFFPLSALIIPHLSTTAYPFWLPFPLPIRIFDLTGGWLVAYFGFAFLLILGGFFLLTRGSFRRKTTTCFLSLYALCILYTLLLRALHITPVTPPFKELPVWELMSSLMLASVHEELGFRLFMLGIPLLVIDLLVGRYAKSTHYFLGGRRIDFSAIFFVVLSSSMFTVAHLPSWDIWKLPPTLLVGVGLGCLYLKEGLLASILVHFSFNCWNTFFILIERGVIQTSYSLDLALGIFNITVLVVFVVSGLVMIAVKIKNLIDKRYSTI